MTTKATCTEIVYTHGSFCGYICGAAAKAVDSKGSPKCGRHSDEAKAARSSKLHAKWKADAEIRHKKQQRLEVQNAVLDMMPEVIAALPLGALRDKLAGLYTIMKGG